MELMRHMSMKALRHVLYMCVNYHVMCEMEYKVLAVVENDMTLCPNEREV